MVKHCSETPEKIQLESSLLDVQHVQRTAYRKTSCYIHIFTVKAPHVCLKLKVAFSLVVFTVWFQRLCICKCVFPLEKGDQTSCFSQNSPFFQHVLNILTYSDVLYFLLPYTLITGLRTLRY